MSPEPKPEWFTFEMLTRLHEVLKDPDMKARLGALDDLDRKIAAAEAHLKRIKSTFSARLSDEWQGFVLAVVGLGFDWLKLSTVYFSLWGFHELGIYFPVSGLAAETLHAIHQWAVVGVASIFVAISLSALLKGAGYLKRSHR